MSLVPRALAVLALASSVGGCVFPYYQYTETLSTGRVRFRTDEVAFISPGTTTRSEVLLRLGPPFWSAREGRVLAYAWIQHNESWFCGAGSYSSDITLYLVEFDGEGRSLRSGFATASSGTHQERWWDAADQVLREWLDRESGE